MAHAFVNYTTQPAKRAQRAGHCSRRAQIRVARAQLSNSSSIRGAKKAPRATGGLLARGDLSPQHQIT